MEKLKPYMVSVLLHHGFTQNELDLKPSQELQEIYSKGMRIYLQQFTSDHHHTQQQIPQNPFTSLADPQEIFNLNLDFFKYFSLDDLTLMLKQQFRLLSMEHAQKMTLILYSCFQETLLQEIENKLQNIPQEEKVSVLELYEQQKNNIQHLININQKLESDEFRDKLTKIMRIKNLIQTPHF